MAASPGVSCIISALLSLLLMASMQFFKVYLTSSRLSTLFTGYLGSIVFMLTLTSINNFEMASFGKQFQIVISMLIALFAVSLVHRVAVTTWYVEKF
ncbi:Keratinocyte-associated protein 2 [Blomia tropicalis]|nr:Keratinocyte-associated protein 2 [Blomia tropicalis]